MTSLFFITRNFPPAIGGIETMAWHLAARLARMPDLRLIVLHFGQARCTRPPEGVWKYLHLPSKGFVSTYLISGVCIPVLALVYRPHLIFNMQLPTSLGSTLVRTLSGTPYFIVGLGLELLPHRLTIYNGFRGMILRKARKVLSISRFTDRLVGGYGVPEARRRVLFPGVDLDRFRPQPTDRLKLFQSKAAPEDFICLTVCRLNPRKGIDTCIRAMAGIRETRRDMKYFIVGGGPDRDRLEKLIRELRLEAAVFLLGPAAPEELPRLYSGADLFLMPCRESRDPPEIEGFGLVFIEAAACGTPSIGSNSGGIPDAIVNEETGFLIEPGDIEGLAEKILRLYDDRELLNQMGARARLRTEAQLNWEKAASRYFNELAECVGGFRAI